MSNRTLNLSDDLYQYLLAVSLREPEILKNLRNATAKLSTHQMQISPEQGQLMALLVQLINARKTLEIGVYTGYSSLAIALALPNDGKVIACDINDEWTTMAKDFWHQAKVDHKIDLQIAPAEKTLDKLINSGETNTFDFIFIDADKINYDVYYEKSLVLLRKNGLMMIDNTFQRGGVIDPNNHTPAVRAVRALNKKLHYDERISLSLLPMSDGITLVLKK